MSTIESAPSHRRRRPLAEETCDYYDDSDEEKDRRPSTDKLYSSTCGIGQFFLNPCLCIFILWHTNCKRKYMIKMASRLKPIHAILLVPLLGFLRYRRPRSFKGVRPHPLRPSSDSQINKLPILIHSLDQPLKKDFGGWLSPIPFHHKVKFPQDKYVLADFGSLHLRTLQVEHFVREIDPNDDEKYNDLRLRELNRMDLDPTSPKYDHDDEADYTECRPPNWKKLYFPTCNSFHEIDMTRGYDRSLTSKVDKNYDSYVFSQGFYRDAWLVENVERKEATVLKTLRFKHDYTPKSFSNVQRDAIVMERLSFSQYVVNMFGHCATSLTVEPIAYEIEERIVPGEGYMKQEDLDDRDDVRPQNDYTSLEKLEFGLAMAESLAVLHSYVGGLIVHDDVQLCQWLRTRDGRLVLGDFNRAQIMDWNEEKGEYCLYNNGYAFGNYRSPEEFAGQDLNEKIDIFSFGNNIYSLMTGLWPFYENEDDGFVQKEIVNGKTAFIDKRYRSRSYAEGKMVELIEQCWRYKAVDRPDIFEVVRFLRRAIEVTKAEDEVDRPKASNY